MNLPSDFAVRTRALLGEDAFRQFCQALEQDTPVSIRINVSKREQAPAYSRQVPWCGSGYYLGSRPTFTFDPLFHAGTYYVQEAASMFVEQALRQYVDTPVVMLDLCAAPGGKSTLARAILPEGSLLVANEVMRNRSQILAENLVKWGHPGVIVTNNDPEDFSRMEGVFDVILTDVPCSGEGMFRKDPVAIEEWSVDNVALCFQRQRRILGDIWNCLKPGGILIYSTCTYNREENEDNVAWIASQLGAEVLEVPVSPEWNITGNLAGADFPVYRFLPHRTQGEGLFLAVLRKYGDADEAGISVARRSKEKKVKGSKNRQKPVVCPNQVKEWLNNAADYEWSVENDLVVAFPATYRDLYDLCRRELRVLHAGVTVASLKGKDCIPHHSLAMSVKCDSTAFPTAELDYHQAIAYLRKEAVALDENLPKGYVLVTYKHIPLGFVKHIGNRANNLYPSEWRIRSGYLPDSVVCVD